MRCSTLSPAMRVGLSYRSSMKYTLEGTLNGVTPVRADVELPDTAILSVWQQVSDRWEAMGDLSYTRWNSLKSLAVVSRASGNVIPGVGETFNYDNSWRIAWGAAYRMNEQAKLKFGIAYDRTPCAMPIVRPAYRITAACGCRWAGSGMPGITARSMSATAISTCVTPTST